MQRQKNVAAIHDISCFGKCSLTVVLPVLSAAGIETSVIPTAVLSTHTGGFTGNTFRDLSKDMGPIMEHWRSLGLTFDAIYTGYLGSFEQLEILTHFFERFHTEENLVLIDPVMGDNGKLYSVFDEQFVEGMARFCGNGDIIVPNMTEAAFMLKRPYQEGPYTKAYVEQILEELAALGPDRIVLTGIFFDDKKMGAASLDKITGKVAYSLSERIEGYYHGTGDVFASSLLAAVLTGLNLGDAAQVAADYTTGCIKRTKEAGTDLRYGLNFEQEIPHLLQLLHLI